MKQLRNFLSFVGLRVNPVAVIPFFLGLSYAFYVTGRIDWRVSALLLLAVILFDMGVSALNKSKIPLMLATLLPALAIGAYLGYLFGAPVVVAGVICVLSGVFYSFGPAPVSLSPYGELVSGAAAGGFLPFIAYSINAPDSPLFTVTLLGNFNADVVINGLAVIRAFLVFFPAMALIANITLAKNIVRVGANKSVILLEIMTGLAYADVVAASLTGASGALCLCAVPSAFIVVPNLVKFHRKHDKIETAKTAVTNFAVVNGLFALFMFIKV